MKNNYGMLFTDPCGLFSNQSILQLAHRITFGNWDITISIRLIETSEQLQ